MNEYENEYKDYYLSFPTVEDVKTFFGIDDVNLISEVYIEGVNIDYIGKMLDPNTEYYKKLLEAMDTEEAIDPSLTPVYYDGLLCNVRSSNKEFNEKIEKSSYVKDAKTPLRVWA